MKAYAIVFMRVAPPDLTAPHDLIAANACPSDATDITDITDRAAAITMAPTDPLVQGGLFAAPTDPLAQGGLFAAPTDPLAHSSGPPHPLTPTRGQPARAAHLLALVHKVAYSRRHAGNGAGAQRVELTSRPVAIFGLDYQVPVRQDAYGRLWVGTAPAEEVGTALEAVAGLPGRHRVASITRLYEQLWGGG